MAENALSPSVLLDVRDGSAWLRLNRPHASNAIDNDMRAALWAALDAIEGNRELRCVIVTGAGKAFAAGSDVRELGELSPAQSVALSEKIEAFHRRLAALPVPVIAAVNGWCLGGGFELALACDIRIASEKARFGLPETTLGIVPGGGGIPRLTRIAGPGVARHLCLSAEIIDARTAYEYGIVTGLTAPEALERKAAEMAARIATLSPSAIVQCKRALDVAGAASLNSAIAAEAQACALCFATEDQKEGFAAFHGKRPARFGGR